MKSLQPHITSAKLRRKVTEIIVLIILGLIVVIGGGWLSWRHYHHTSTTLPVTTPAISKKATPSATATVPANPYTGWQSFCDSQYGFCFQYPAGWQLQHSVNAAGATTATLASPDKATTISYTNPYPTAINPVKFTVVSMNGLFQSNVGFTVVGGFTPAAFAPSYGVADPLILKTYPVAVGKTANFPAFPRFYDINNTHGATGVLQAVPTATFKTAAAAKAWFKTADAKTSRQILESVKYQPPTTN